MRLSARTQPYASARLHYRYDDNIRTYISLMVRHSTSAAVSQSSNEQRGHQAAPKMLSSDGVAAIEGWTTPKPSRQYDA